MDWRRGRGERERNCNDIARNTQHLFHFRTSLAPPPPPPPPRPPPPLEKRGICISKQLNASARGFIRTGLPFSKLITVPRQVRLVSLSKKNSHRFLVSQCSSPVDRDRSIPIRFEIRVSPFCFCFDRSAKERSRWKKIDARKKEYIYIYITRHRRLKKRKKKDPRHLKS